MEKLSQQLDWLAQEYSHVPALLDEQSYLSFYNLNLFFKKACFLLQQQQALKEPKQRVALIFDNSLLHVIFSLACLRCGLTQLSIDNKENKDIIIDLLDSNDIDWILTDTQNIYAQLDTHAPTLRSDMRMLNQQQVAVSFASFNLDNKACLVTGSGSTGKPKQIAFTFNQYAKVLFERSDPFDIKAGERFMSMVPVHFQAGKARTLIYLLKGTTCILIRQSKTPIAVILDRLMVQHVYCVDLHLSALLKYTQETNTTNNVRFPYLKSLITSGSPISVERVNQVRKQLSKQLFILYGANEILHVSVAKPEDLARFPNSIGKLVPDAELRLLNENKQPVLLNEVGHAHVRTSGMAEGYENNSQASEENFYQTWFMPKDLLRQNEEGYLFFEGRSDDLMIFDGMNIYPVEIESLLEQLPEVKECAAFPVHTQAHGDIPVVALVLHENSLHRNESYFSDYLQAKMGKRYPRKVLLMDELPRNSRGKVLKYQLKEQFQVTLEQ